MKLSWSAIFTLICLLFRSACASEGEDRYRKLDADCQAKRVDWLKAGAPGEKSPQAEAYMDAAMLADRNGSGGRMVDEVLAGGPVANKVIALPRKSVRVKLKPLRIFPGVRARLEDEAYASVSRRQGDWLARRLTVDRLEVWTPDHGWLFDRRGRLVHQVRKPEGAGGGREWFGAFLPDGQWVTTADDEIPGRLNFYSAAGAQLGTMDSAQLARNPDPDDGRVGLIGWARSDQWGKGWVACIGSEGGWATVWVGPSGKPRILEGNERWRQCYPRALGPRGMDVDMAVPADADGEQLQRTEPWHGPRVGYPTYSTSSDSKHTVANGNYVFGFWPHRTSYFIGSETYLRSGDSAPCRKYMLGAIPSPLPIEDKTWFFNPEGKLLGWVRARRVGDAADGHSMLFRVTADSRIATLTSELHFKKTRRFTWEDGRTADAVTLWDDLKLGLFIRGERLVLARWD